VFEFVVLSTQRAAQLMRGCSPRVSGVHKPTVIAQYEVSAGLVAHAAPAVLESPGTPALPVLPPGDGTS
jgi:hypothetical protein